MWHELDMDAMAEEDYVLFPVELSADEMEQLVVFVRLYLYNRNKTCGVEALRRRLRDHYHARPLPSRRRIARILVLYGLTHRRTGWYEGEEHDWLPASSQVPPAERRYYNFNIN